MKSKGWLCCWVICSVLLLVPQSFAEDWLYTVRKGDTIWGLSHKYLKEPLKFQEIQKYNNVEFDRQLPPGVTLKFPMEYLKFAPAEVSVSAINGDVQFVRRGVKESLTLSQKLVLGDILFTAVESSVALVFADGSTLLLGESSELIFDVQTKWGETGMVDTRVRLRKGSAEGRVQPLRGPGAHFEVQTPSAVATVRGTEFRVRLDQADESVVFNEVDEGAVSVQLHENKASVKQGFGLITSAKLPISKPKALLPNPKLVSELKKYAGHPVTFTWQPVDDAKSYLVELFDDKALTQLVHKEVLSINQVTLPEVDVGEYSLRIRAIDNSGLQGLNTVHHFVISPVPTSPELQSFEPNYLAGDALTFEWRLVSEATQYRWQLAKDSQFKHVVAQEVVSGTRHVMIEGLAQGDYYWRVAAGNHNGYGQYSETQHFEVMLPEIPHLSLSEDEISLDENLSVSWDSVPLASEYYWQVSSDESFNQIIDEGTVEEGTVDEGTVKQVHLELDGLPEGQLYLRVAAIGPYNQGRFSEKTSILVEPQDNGKTTFSIGSLLLFLLIL